MMGGRRLNVRRECVHGGKHAHGTRTMYRVDGCTCTPCADAESAHGARRRRLQAYGRWESSLVDAGPVRAHMAGLRASGMGYRRIAALSGKTYAQLQRIDHAWAGHPPYKRLARATAAAILAVQPDLAPGALVDGTGTRRRLQALVARGWSYQELSIQMGRGAVYRRHARRLATAPGRITHRTRLEVVALYERLWDQAPPAGSAYEHATVARMLRIAAASGWVPPLAWNDEDLDDPGAKPALRWLNGRLVDAQPAKRAVDEIAVSVAVEGVRVPLTRQERQAAALALRDRGLSAAETAARVGASERSVQRYRVKGQAA